MDSENKIAPRDFETVVKARKKMKNDALDAAAAGNRICGGYAALIASSKLARFIDDLDDYSDEDYDERPF